MSIFFFLYKYLNYFKTLAMFAYWSLFVDIQSKNIDKGINYYKCTVKYTGIVKTVEKNN